VNRSQPQIATPDTQPLIPFEMIEKRHNQWGIDLFEHQVGWSFTQLLLRELEQLTKGIPIGTDCVRTGLTLLHQPIREEALQQRSETVCRVHG